MAEQQVILGRIPTYAGPWDANYVNPKTGHNGYPLKKRVTLYGSEFQSKLEDNTYAPATLNQAGTELTFDTTHWEIISNGSDIYLLHNQITEEQAEIEAELADKADKDGAYPDLIAGNLFGETQTTDKFLFRPTAGIQDIESGEPPVGGGAVRKVEGNAVAWNQIMNEGEVVVNTSPGKMSASFPYSIPSGHIVCISFEIKKSSNYSAADGWYEKVYLAHEGNAFGGNISYSSIPNDDTFHRITSIVTNSNSLNKNLYFMYYSGTTGTVTFRNINVIDLTLLFGAGNEPSTVEAFESWLSQNIGLKDYYPYNAGELIPVKDYKVKSVGFNAWDEQWRLGYYDTGQGNHYSASNQICTKNKIRVLPNTQYTLTISSLSHSSANAILFYRSDNSYLGYIDWFGANDGFVFTTPEKACYMIIDFGSDYGPTYNGDICINLSYDDDKDGTYEQHWEHQVNIDVTKIYGKLNGEGSSVVVFPDGLKKAGTVYDEIVQRGNQVIGIKRVGSVDLGTLYFIYYSSYQCIASSITGGRWFPQKRDDICCSNYAVVNEYWDRLKDNPSDKLIQFGENIQGTGYGCVAIKDSSITSSGVIASLDGVILYYPLATPEEYILDDDIIPVLYAVDDYGTEEVLLGNDEDVVSCAPTMTIKYGINAADTVSSLPHTYVSSKYQSLNDVEQRTARANIGAASKNEVAVIRKQLEAIDKKVENDYYVDMGLPSGVLWAKRNIFTGTGNDMGFAPSEYSYDADYFSWGNTDGHIPSGSTFDYSFDATTYASTDGAKLTGNIPLSHDAARVNCGEPWRMPTTEEFKELFDNCDFIDASGNVIASTTANKLITIEGYKGIRLRSKINGGILFFACDGVASDTSVVVKPDRGYYDTCSLYSSDERYEVYFLSTSVHPQNNRAKFLGLTIRPVM